MAPHDSPDDEPPGTGGPGHTEGGQAVPWESLPDGVRVRAIALAAHVVGTVPIDQLPAALTAVARFTPGKRARRGAAPLARALQRDVAFRALVAQHVADRPLDPSDPTGAAARAFLLQLPDSERVVADAARADEVVALRAQVTELSAAVEKLTARLSEAGRGASQQRSAAAAPAADGQAEADRLRRRLREQGTRVKRAEDAARQAVTKAEQERDEALTRAAQEHASAEHWHARAEQEAHRASVAHRAVDRWRDEAGRARADADRRIELLLQTVQDAASGLRREWKLATGGADPADVIARQLPGAAGAVSRSVDAGLLLDWLALPGAHLIVDGYNVTKTGYPDLPLADQRDRLTRSLASLAARTGGEVTVVFDGAAVVAPPASQRGVRVLFSPPDIIADDVIRQLAAAEPSGRVVVVVSSDREVIDGVRRSGARTAPSPVLLAVLGEPS